MIELRARIRQELGLPCRGKDVLEVTQDVFRLSRVSGVMRHAALRAPYQAFTQHTLG
jgi:hypothetical protein